VLTRATFEAFEAYLERAVERLDETSPVRTLVREHFAFDDPGAKRGKRLRPLILVAAAETEGAQGEDAFPAAAAVELLHNFSLVHDDIEDRDEFRHGRPTLWVRHGIPAAISAGDAMLRALLRDAARRARAFRRATHRRDDDVPAPHALRAVHRPGRRHRFRDLALGDVRRILADDRRQDRGTVRGGLRAGRAGGRHVGRARGGLWTHGSRIRSRLSGTRRHLGTWGTPAETGKPAGADIRRRKWSFPVAWAFAEPPSPERAIVAAAYASIGELRDAQADEVIAALERLGAHRAADDACDAYVAQAVAVAAEHGLDRGGRLADIFSSTAHRTA